MNKKLIKIDKDIVNDKAMELMTKFKEKSKIRRNNHIWFWILICIPYGLYRAIKYKAFSKLFIIILFIIFGLIITLTIDVFANPNRLINNNIKTVVNKYNELGVVRTIENQGTVDDKYVKYAIITTKGKYIVYFSAVDNHKYNISGIYELLPDRKIIMENDKIDEIFPEITTFLKEDCNVSDYGELISTEKTIDNNSQIIRTTTGEYSFKIKYEQIESISKINNTTKENELIYNKEIEPQLPADIVMAIKKESAKYGTISKVKSYILKDDSQEYILSTSKGSVKVIKEDNGTILAALGK